MSTPYLQQYSSDLFHICTSYWATSEGVNFGKFFKFVTLTLSSFDLGIQYDSLIGVFMGQRGYPQNAGILIVLVWTIPKLCLKFTHLKPQPHVQGIMRQKAWWPNKLCCITKLTKLSAYYVRSGVKRNLVLNVTIWPLYIMENDQTSAPGGKWTRMAFESAQ